MPRLKLYLTYDGSRYKGWQRQTNTRHTIQEILENKLSIICAERVSITSSGRTDAGVHARIQVAHVTVPERTMRLVRDPSPIFGEPRLKQALNRMLPPNIRLLHVEHVSDEFHAIRDVRRKTYVYFIDPNPVQWPELRRYAWSLRLPMDWGAIERATPALLGRHDFKGFCGKGSKVKSTVRTIFDARWGTVRWQGLSGSVDVKALRLTGSGFLKHMVRSIAGTLVHIGNGKAPVDQIQRIIETGDRAEVGPTAPATGLWLWDILY